MEMVRLGQLLAIPKEASQIGAVSSPDKKFINV